MYQSNEFDAAAEAPAVTVEADDTALSPIDALEQGIRALRKAHKYVESRRAVEKDLRAQVAVLREKIGAALADADDAAVQTASHEMRLLNNRIDREMERIEGSTGAVQTAHQNLQAALQAAAEVA